MKNYSFFIVTVGGETITWNGLSRTQAVNMYNNTSRAAPVDVIRFGWEEK